MFDGITLCPVSTAQLQRLRKVRGGKAGRASAAWRAMLARNDVYGENQQYADKERHGTEDDKCYSASEQHSVRINNTYN